MLMLYNEYYINHQINNQTNKWNMLPAFPLNDKWTNPELFPKKFNVHAEATNEHQS